MPNESEFQMALDADDGLQVLAIVGGAGGGGFFFEGKKDLGLGNAVGFDACESPSWGIDFHVSRWQKKSPLPFGDIGEK